MLLPLFSILVFTSPGHGASQPPDPQPSTHVPAPNLPEDTTIGNKESGKGSDYIVNGIESPKYSLGYQARVEICDPPNSNNCISCGGTVVHRRYVITAAHCLHMDNNTMTPDKVQFKVTVGDHNLCDGVNEGGDILLVSEVFEHPDFIYSPQPTHSDIAIFKLQQDIIFNDSVWPACLPTSPDTDYSGESVTVSGWGGTQAWNADGQKSPEQKQQCELRVTTLKVQANSDIECQLKQKDSSRLCAYTHNTSTCSGDSGGPLALKKRGDRYLLLGVTSYSSGCADTRGMADVFARVQGFLPWIAQYVPDDSEIKNFCKGVQ